MSQVWAAHEGSWLPEPARAGWTHVLSFSTLADLTAKLAAVRPSLRGTVTKLVNFLSSQFLPNIHVIGFEVFGYLGTNGLPKNAGQVLASLSPDKLHPDLAAAGPTAAHSNSPILTEYSWFAKWSLNGTIIRL